MEVKRIELKKCPRCRRVMEEPDGGDCNMRVVKARLFKYRPTGGPLLVNCRHCRKLFPFQITSHD
jgi:hypothetical protein